MQKKFLIILVSMLLIATAIPAFGFNINVENNNNPNPSNNGDKWMKTYGGADDEFGSSVQQTPDGGYIIFGITESFGSGREDFWLIKTDSEGNKIWDQTYGGEEADMASFGQQTSDGGYIMVGWTYSFDTVKADIWLVKTDSQGNKVWDKLFGGNGYDTASEVWQTSDNGYVIIGYTDSFGSGSRDMWLIKTDADGNLLWDKTYGGSKDDQGHSMKITSDGGFILAGGKYTSQTTNKFDVWLIKTNSAGEIIWDKTYGESEHETAWCIQQTTDGGYIVCGEKDVGGLNEYDIWLLKTDSNGELLWDKLFGGFNIDRGSSVQQTADGGYVIAGDTFAGPRIDGLLIKTDSSGEEEWRKTYGNYNTDITVYVQQTNDGGYILTGYYQAKRFQLRDLWLIKTDENGDAPNNLGRSIINYRLFEMFPNISRILKNILDLLVII